jgi:hypothetical protein
VGNKKKGKQECSQALIDEIGRHIFFSGRGPGGGNKKRNKKKKQKTTETIWTTKKSGDYEISVYGGTKLKSEDAVTTQLKEIAAKPKNSLHEYEKLQLEAEQAYQAYTKEATGGSPEQAQAMYKKYQDVYKKYTSAYQEFVSKPSMVST